MADINQVITLGIGTPADIEHFILVGLSHSVVAIGHTVRHGGSDVYQAGFVAGDDVSTAAVAGADVSSPASAGAAVFATGTAGADDVT